VTVDAQVQYKDYWVGVGEEREKSAYYERRYDHIVHRIHVAPGSKVLDVAGGNGQLLRFLGIRQADVLDISESGLEAAKRAGYGAIQGDVEQRFPMEGAGYETAFCFEVLEHLHHPERTLSEIFRVLKPGGVLYVGQPNMPEGGDHVRRYYLGPLREALNKAGFGIEWVDYVPAATAPEGHLDDIRRNPSWSRKAKSFMWLFYSLLPFKARYATACKWPDRFGLIFVVKAVKAANP